MRPQVCGTFKSCKSSSNRTKLQRNLNNIGVRSFILTGAPLKCLSAAGNSKCASKSLGFARVDQIRCTELLSKRSCPNLPACGWSFQNTRKTARRRIKGRVAKWIALDAPKRRSYGKSTVPLEQKREGRLRRKKRDTQLQCAILMLAICVLPIAADDSCSSNLHNEQSCYYRQANWNSFFGHPRELEFLH